MDALIKMVASKAGISEAQAKLAVNTVMGFLKEKLPAPIATQVEAALKQEATVKQAEDLVDKGMGAIGGLLNKK